MSDRRRLGLIMTEVHKPRNISQSCPRYISAQVGERESWRGKWREKKDMNAKKDSWAMFYFAAEEQPLLLLLSAGQSYQVRLLSLQSVLYACVRRDRARGR